MTAVVNNSFWSSSRHGVSLPWCPLAVRCLPFLACQVDSAGHFTSRIIGLSTPVILSFNYSLPPASICLFFSAFISTPCLWDVCQILCFPANLSWFLASFWFNGRIPRSLRQVLNPWYRRWMQECGASGDFTWIRQHLLVCLSCSNDKVTSIGTAVYQAS